METQTLRTEDTSASFHTITDFNIAEAFPPTDRLLAKVARARWHRRKEWIIDNRGVLLVLAAGLLGALSSRRTASR